MGHWNPKPIFPDIKDSQGLITSVRYCSSQRLRCHIILSSLGFHQHWPKHLKNVFLSLGHQLLLVISGPWFYASNANDSVFG